MIRPETVSLEFTVSESKWAADLLDRCRTGDLGALNDVATLYRRALATIPAGHPDQAVYLNYLCGTLWTMFERTGELAALTEAVQVGRDAVAATPAGHPRPGRAPEQSRHRPADAVRADRGARRAH